jgi:hypothetical protein
MGTVYCSETTRMSERNGGHHEPTFGRLAGVSRDFEQKGKWKSECAVLGHYTSEHFIVCRTA